MLSSLPGWKGPKPGAQGLARLGGLGLRGAVGLGVLSSVLGAAGEFADAQDPAGARGNLADATGMGLGSALAGGAVIAPALLAGGPIGIGTLVLGSLAAAAGGQLGKGAVRGLADAGGLTSSDPVAKDLENSIKAARAGIA
ncbi:MAG: hypothetical protein VKI63_02525, partial [Cyanobium sp.]|nr:hypothetical protein [Cyanobium sp.]